MAQENKTHDGQDAFVAGVVRIGAQVVHTGPKSFFDGFCFLSAAQLIQQHRRIIERRQQLHFNVVKDARQSASSTLAQGKP